MNISEFLEKEFNLQVKPEYLKDAFTHCSCDHQHSYEVLEFLGDAIIDFVVSEHLYHKYPNYRQGDLSSLKNAYVSGENLGIILEQLNLESFIQSADNQNIVNQSVRADVYESLVAAIYLSNDVAITKEFIVKTLLASKPVFIDYKSILQEEVQKKFHHCPVYIREAEFGPDHDKTFYVSVKVNHQKVGMGFGKSIKFAEREAARTALTSELMIKEVK